MEETRTKIAECKQACVDIDAKLKEQFEAFGRALWDVLDTEKDTKLHEYLEFLQTKQQVVAEFEKDLRDIQQAREASDTAKEEISRIEQRLASIEFEKNSLYSRIGVITYEEYAAGEIGEEFSLLFASITHQNAELSRIQKNLKENELKQVAASFFEKMSLKMKRNKLKGEMEKLETAREDLFRNAGKQICNSELMELVKSRNAHAIAQDFKRLDQERDRMYALLESKKFDYNKSQDILDQSGAESDAIKKIKELEKGLSKAEREQSKAYIELGKAAVHEPGYPEMVAQQEGDEAQTVETIYELLDQRNRLEQELTYLDAKIRIRELESVIEVDHQKEQRVTAQISALNEQLKEIDQRIEQTRSQIDELGKILQQFEDDQEVPDEHTS